MTLESFKEFWKTIALKHKDVNEFLVGSWYDAAESGNNKYPLVYWELPYTINYNQDLSKRLDTITCSLSVFINTKMDDIQDSHTAISYAKSIGDAIITKSRLEAREFSIVSVNAVTVREYSEDYVAGVRYDIIVLLQRDICDSEINTYFN